MYSLLALSSFLSIFIAILRLDSGCATIRIPCCAGDDAYVLSQRLCFRGLNARVYAVASARAYLSWKFPHLRLQVQSQRSHGTAGHIIFQKLLKSQELFSCLEARYIRHWKETLRNTGYQIFPTSEC